MIISCGKTKTAKIEERRVYYEALAQKARKWHRIFAWRPLVIGTKHGRKQCAWLCTIERRYPDAMCIEDDFLDQGWFIRYHDPEYRLPE